MVRGENTDPYTDRKIDFEESVLRADSDPNHNPNPNPNSLYEARHRLPSMYNKFAALMSGVTQGGSTIYRVHHQAPSEYGPVYGPYLTLMCLNRLL